MLLFSNMSDETPSFSLELSSDLRDMRDWVHEFAASVIRPAAAEWDEREEFPWPILEEASGIGLYRWTSTRSSSSRDLAWAFRWRSRSCSGGTRESGCR